MTMVKKTFTYCESFFVFYIVPILYSISFPTNTLSLPYFKRESSVNACASFASQVSKYGFTGIIEKGVVG
jgi:hypothetical protein